MKTNTSWGNSADWYDEYLSKDDTYQSKVILPNLLRIVAPKKGMSILDLACGQGFFSGAFAKEGANVVGADISSELVAIAKKQVPLVKFFVTPADKLAFAKDGFFDVVTIVLAIQNIQNMAGVFREARRVLKPSGKLVVVLNHPAFRNPGVSDWGFDEEKGRQYRRIDAYMTESKREIDMHPGQKNNKNMTVSFHRPLQVYFKTLANAGFSISRREEWVSHKESGKGPRKEAEDRARAEFPLFLCLEAR